jgi:transcription elongation factor Elf1
MWQSASSVPRKTLLFLRFYLGLWKETFNGIFCGQSEFSKTSLCAMNGNYSVNCAGIHGKLLSQALSMQKDVAEAWVEELVAGGCNGCF